MSVTSDKLESRVALGRSPRASGIRLLCRGIATRAASWRHPTKLWCDRQRDTKHGAAFVVSRLTAAAELSVAADHGGPRDTIILIPGATVLFDDLVSGTNALFTVTRAAVGSVRWHRGWRGRSRHDSPATETLVGITDGQGEGEPKVSPFDPPASFVWKLMGSAEPSCDGRFVASDPSRGIPSPQKFRRPLPLRAVLSHLKS